jgi:hypothetical protein
MYMIVDMCSIMCKPFTLHFSMTQTNIIGRECNSPEEKEMYFVPVFTCVGDNNLDDDDDSAVLLLLLFDQEEHFGLGGGGCDTVKNSQRVKVLM